MDADEADLSSLGAAIQSAREAARLSQRELGRRVGVDQAVVSKWIRGLAAPSIARLVRLDRALGLRPGTLLERAGWTEPRPLTEAIENAGLDEDTRRILHAAVDRARHDSHPDEVRTALQQWIGDAVKIAVADALSANDAAVAAYAQGSVAHSTRIRRLTGRRRYLGRTRPTDSDPLPFLTVFRYPDEGGSASSSRLTTSTGESPDA